MSDNAYINDLETRLAEAEKQLAEAKATIERESKPWTHKLITPPTIEGALRKGYPDLSEDYELAIRDTGHSDRILVLSSPDLDERINDLQAELSAANATIAACKAAGFIDELGEVRKVLGTLPLTADGCVIGLGEFPMWCIGTVTRGGDDVQEVKEWEWEYDGYTTQAYPSVPCYSTREAAAATKGGS